jgi:hypothetical protein
MARGVRGRSSKEQVMAIAVSWANSARTLIRVFYAETWNWDEWSAADERCRQLIAASGHPVDIIHDARKTAIPANTLSVLPSLLRKTAVPPAPNTGLQIIVGRDDFLDILASVLSRAASQPEQSVFHVPSMQAAFAVLGREETLPATGTLR